MRVRVGVLRAFIGILWAALLVVPVGIDTPRGPEVAAVGEALAELAGGGLGIGILSALVVGDELARAAGVRVLLIVLATVAFVLSGMLSGPEPETATPKRRRCAECRAWVSVDMSECPGCGRAMYVT